MLPVKVFMTILYSIGSQSAPRENPIGSASYLFTFVYIFRNLLWGSVNNGQPLHGLHNTKRLRTTALQHCNKIPSLRKNRKTITITSCKNEFTENISLKITRPNVHLLKYGG